MELGNEPGIQSEKKPPVSKDPLILQETVGVNQKPVFDSTGHYKVELDLEISYGERIQVTFSPQAVPSTIEKNIPVQSVPIPAGELSVSSPLQIPTKEVETSKTVQSVLEKPIDPKPHFFSWLQRKSKATTPVLQRAGNIKLPYKESILFGLSLLVLLLTRVIRLTEFPIYYFCDEAVVSMLASDFMRDGFHSYDGELFPTYFKDGGTYSLGVNVYQNVLAQAVFGRSVLVSRLVEVLVGSLTAIWLALLLKDIYKIRFWWLAPLLLAITPVWFIHSRIAFGFTVTVAFFTGFLYYYCLYRSGKTGFIYPALLMGALCFYTYYSGTGAMIGMGIILLAVDFRYHWQNRAVLWKAAILLAVLIAPLIRFVVNHPTEYQQLFQLYNSTVASSAGWLEKGLRVLGAYLAGLNPVYWFWPHEWDLPIYTMKGYSNLPVWMLPLTLYGLYRAIRGFRQPEMRLMLFGLLVSPIAAAFVDLGARRALLIVVPLLILTCLGLVGLLEWVEGKWKTPPRGALSWVAFLLCSVFAFGMLNDALTHGPTWYHDYTLDGMQYGASQVYAAAKEYSQEYPELTIFVTPNFIFQADVVNRFFTSDDPKILPGTYEVFTYERRDDLEKSAFVLTPLDYQFVLQSNKFKPPTVDKILPYPDGNPGFYFVRLQYQDNIDEIFQAEIDALASPVSDTTVVNGETWQVLHSQLDMGPIGNLFDGTNLSLIRTAVANPLIVEITFPTPRKISGFKAEVGAEAVQLTVVIPRTDQNQPFTETKFFDISEGNKIVTIEFGETIETQVFYLELFDLYAPPRSNVHLWDVEFLP